MSLFKGVKVLVVEDDENMREIFCEIFQMEGAAVNEASGGNAAYSMLTNNNFDIVFSDARMPDGDGIFLAKKVRDLKSPKPVFFICSGYNDLDEKARVELDIAKIFEKPFDHKTMLNEVSEIFKTHHASR